MSLLDYRDNIYSQNGEDGILSEILRRLELTAQREHWCVEFGAWNGIHLSNTFRLIGSEGWNGVFIEGDPQKHADLKDTAKRFTRIRPIQSMVDSLSGSGNSLDDILSRTDCPQTYDVLSIDIDSNDLDVWLSHREYQPRIVVIEINSSIPPGVLQWHSDNAQGNSFSSTLNVARERGYTLVCHTGNMIFVRDELMNQVGLDDSDYRYPERLFLWDWVNRRPSAKDRAFQVGSFLPKSIKRPIKNALKWR